MLTKFTSLNDAFSTIQGKTFWISAQITECITKTTRQTPSANDVTDMAKMIANKYGHYPIAHFALFFGNAQFGQRAFADGEIEQFGSFSLNTIVRELSDCLQRLYTKGRGLAIKAEEERKRAQYRQDIKTGKCIGWSEYVNSLSEQDKKSEAFKNASRLVEMFHLNG